MFQALFCLVMLCAGTGLGLMIALAMDVRAMRKEREQREAWQAEFRRTLAERQKLKEQERALRRGQIS